MGAGASSDPGRGRAKLSYRISLAVAIPFFAILTGGLITWRSYVATSATIQELATSLFREVTRQTVSSTRGHILRAVPTSVLIDEELRFDLLDREPEALAQGFVAVLRANPDFAWVSYGAQDGSFVGATRSDGALLTNRSVIHADGRTELWEHEVLEGGALRLRRHEEDSGYDPRTRPFYELARARGRRTWTPPYVFFDEGIPGITCATPHLVQGELRGVITVDFDLNSLSEMVSELRLSEHGSVFVFTPDGTMLAHPTLRLVAEHGHGGEGTLLEAADVDDPVVAAYFRAAQASGVAARGGEGEFSEQFFFEVEGEPWLASYTVFVIDDSIRWVVGVAAPESDFMGVVEDNNLNSLLISLGALAVAFVLAVFLSRMVSRPLVAVAREMERVGAFELDDHAREPTVFREIDQMDRALRAMKSSLRSFASYVPRDVVRAMLASGQGAKLEGQTREMSIFFSDVAGFTSLAETMRPDELVEMLGGYLEEMTAIIGAEGGTVDKFIGDGIMAFWGAPVPNDEHAEHACVAALRCQQRLQELRADESHPWARILATRVGIATGSVLVGNIGTHERMNYTVMGDTVNLAARLEGLNKQYGIGLLVSEATYRAAEHRVLARPVDLVAVKGKARGVRVYELLAMRGEASEAQVSLAARSEAALDAYLARDFAAAAAAWEALGEGDPVARIMAERARAYAAAAPPLEWDGVYTATTK